MSFYFNMIVYGFCYFEKLKRTNRSVIIVLQADVSSSLEKMLYLIYLFKGRSLLLLRRLTVLYPLNDWLVVLILHFIQFLFYLLIEVYCYTCVIYHDCKSK